MYYYEDDLDDDDDTKYFGGRRSRGTASIPGKDDDRKLFVGGLGRQTTDGELRDYFSKFGQIDNISLKTDPLTGQSRGFAFIVFSNPRTIEKLLCLDHYINRRRIDPRRVSNRSEHAKVFVGGLTPEITDGDIKRYFSQYGTVLEVESPFNRRRNERKRFCFITFSSKRVVYDLLKIPKQYINGKAVDVRRVRTNFDRRSPSERRGRNDRRGSWGANHSHSNCGDYLGYSSGCGSNDIYDRYDSSDYIGSFDDFGYGHDGLGRSKGGSRQYHRHQPY